MVLFEHFNKFHFHSPKTFRQSPLQIEPYAHPFSCRRVGGCLTSLAARSSSILFFGQNIFWRQAECSNWNKFVCKMRRNLGKRFAFSPGSFWYCKAAAVSLSDDFYVERLSHALFYIFYGYWIWSVGGRSRDGWWVRSINSPRLAACGNRWLEQVEQKFLKPQNSLICFEIIFEIHLNSITDLLSGYNRIINSFRVIKMSFPVHIGNIFIFG